MPLSSYLFPLPTSIPHVHPLPGEGADRCGRSPSSQPTRAASPPTPLGPTLEMGRSVTFSAHFRCLPKAPLLYSCPYSSASLLWCNIQKRAPPSTVLPTKVRCGWGGTCAGTCGDRRKESLASRVCVCVCVGPNKDPVLWKGRTVSTSLSSRRLAPSFTNAWCCQSSCCGRSGECGGIDP